MPVNLKDTSYFVLKMPSLPETAIAFFLFLNLRSTLSSKRRGNALTALTTALTAHSIPAPDTPVFSGRNHLPTPFSHAVVHPMTCMAMTMTQGSQGLAFPLAELRLWPGCPWHPRQQGDARPDQTRLSAGLSEPTEAVMSVEAVCTTMKPLARLDLCA